MINNMTHGQNASGSGCPFQAAAKKGSRLKLKPLWFFTLLLIVISTCYWLLIASDRFVSESHIVIQRTDISGQQSMDVSSLITGAGGASRADQLLLRDYLLSVDMMKKLDAKLNLRAHYSDDSRDIISRMWRKDPQAEWLYRHYLTRVSVELDDYDGVLVIKAQAYDAEKAQQIVSMLVSEGENYMNKLAHNLAGDQMKFLLKEVQLNNERAITARKALLTYQNTKGMVSPKAATENMIALVAKLEAQRTELETQRSALQSYLVPTHPNIVQLNQQIAAVAHQIVQEQSKLTSVSGDTLNRNVEEFQRLEMEAEFAGEVYKTTLVALERVKIEASRTIKKVSVLQYPTFPEYPLEPRRLYNSFAFILYILLFAGVMNLLLAVVRDHKD